jgi:hypothetical protein
MEAIIFCGIQASGKSTFFKEYFFKTHIRISLDLLGTRHKENIFLQTCFAARQRFVVDNTNATKNAGLNILKKQKHTDSGSLVIIFIQVLTMPLQEIKTETGKNIYPLLVSKALIKNFSRRFMMRTLMIFTR